MAEVIIGMAQFERRLASISGTAGGLVVMRTLARDTIAYLKAAVPRKTSTTGRQFRAERVTAHSAEITGSRVAEWLDKGTGIYGPRHQRIVPKNKKALSWTGGSFGPGGSLTLSGRRRSGAAGRGAAQVTVRSTRGMRARPFVDKALKDAATRNHVLLELVASWDRAA